MALHGGHLTLGKKAVEKIKSGGLVYSIFYPSTFMENFDKGEYVKGSKILLAGTSRHKMYYISGSDYGKQVVRAFTLDTGNHEYVVQGPDGYTAQEAAKLYADNYTLKKLSIRKMPLGLLYLLGKFCNKLNHGARVIDALNNYPEKFEAEKTWQDLGKPQTNFIDYIKALN